MARGESCGEVCSKRRRRRNTGGSDKRGRKPGRGAPRERGGSGGETSFIVKSRRHRGLSLSPRDNPSAPSEASFAPPLLPVDDGGSAPPSSLPLVLRAASLVLLRSISHLSVFCVLFGIHSRIQRDERTEKRMSSYFLRIIKILF